MKTFMLAAIAALSLGFGVAQAQSLSHAAPIQNSYQTSPGLIGGGG